ncbi:hypothetical protein [Prolixibacter denitrificans]|uniref:Uncharacterized protein n=1 Tax=Prolixibacter denitrificans TaxID=1541063 RepID=A0A2P8CJW4_9BACT|nr:hypothetical protein [Prolixibacter denitrificans]PSK85260.1 hypothetical protein CLV93_101212 [Prolixibacter denitrificans]GET19882.1 hypothetical protein JCM18694_01280 [Prolixibacter denitrificans]
MELSKLSNEEKGNLAIELVKSLKSDGADISTLKDELLSVDLKPDDSGRVRSGTNRIKLGQLENDIRRAVEFINGPLHSAFDSLGVEFSFELVKDVFSGGSKFGELFNSKLHKDLSLMSIPASRTLIENSARDGLQEFNNVVSDGRSRFGYSVFDFITFEDGSAVFSDDGMNHLQDECGIFLSDPEEISLYSAHLKACDALNDLFGGYARMDWHKIFDFEKDGTFKPSPVYYDVLLNGIKNAKGKNDGKD